METVDRRRFLEWAGIAPVGLAATGCASVPGVTGPSAGSADCWIEVSLERIAWNLTQIRRRVGGRAIMAVIKGNAYGHGLVPVGRFLESRGVEALAVGKLQEALDLRDAGVRIPILNLGPILPDHAAEIIRGEITQTVYTDEFRLLSEQAARLSRRASVQVNVDTGLGRVGVAHADALSFLDEVGRAQNISLRGVFTALTEEPEFDAIQLRRVRAVCDGAKTRGIEIPHRHAASSAACLAMPAAHLDMVRPGIALYGHYPSDAEAEARKIDLRPAMQLKARVSFVKTLRPGESISYHRAFVAERETVVATLPIGYSDNYPYQAAKKSEVILGGRRYKTIGLVTANHTTVDITGSEGVAVGDEAVLFGEQGGVEISATEVAEWAGTSAYKILIQASPLLPRRFV